MRDTSITVKRKKIEIITLIICFVVANLANLYAIVRYKTSFSELFTSLGYVVVATVVLYVIWTVIRFIFYAIRGTKHI
jgi:cytochrome b